MTPTSTFRSVGNSPQSMPASATAVSAPINQPSTKRLTVLEMLGANTPPWKGGRMDKATDRIAVLSKQYPMTLEAGSVKGP